MEREVHDFIIWNNALNEFDFLFNEINKKFQIIEVYEVTWTNENFEKNLRRFYGSTLPNSKKKIKACGLGPFRVIVFFDPHPNYRLRKTSLGKQMSNVNVYDIKKKLRKKLEGKFPIHGSIHVKEANHDLALIFGKHKDEILKQDNKKWDMKIKEFKNDVFGSNGWESIQDVFYLLNSTTNYVILRNFEKYPNDILSDDHPDIDLLVDETIHVPYIINQLNVVENIKNSPDVIIKNKKVKFDLKYVGDTYYDEKWSQNMLKNKILFKDDIYILNDLDYFYTLIYHCVIHGAEFSKYKTTLQNLAQKFKIQNFSIDKPRFEIKLKELLDEFMKENKYTYTNSLKYRISHNETIRLSKVAISTTKKEGLSGLIRATKGKINRKIIKKNN